MSHGASRRVVSILGLRDATPWQVDTPFANIIWKTQKIEILLMASCVGNDSSIARTFGMRSTK